jgi:hypothetical protein
MKVFDMIGSKITVKPESLMIPEFKLIWESDKSKDKGIALNKLSFIVFLCDNSDSNPYKNYSESDRSEILKKDFDISNKELESLEVAIRKYRDLSTTRYERAVQSALKSLEKVERYYDYIDQLPIEQFDITEFLGSAEKLGKAVESLRKLEKLLEADRKEDSKVRGGNEIGDYELP